MEQAMAQLFADGTHVRLRTLFLDGNWYYLYADDNGSTVSLIPNRASLNAAWLVHAVPETEMPNHGTGAIFFRLCGAAYGLYLTRSRENTQFGHFLLRQSMLRVFDGWLDDAVWTAYWTGNHFYIGHVTYDPSHIGYASQNPMDFLITPWIIEPIPQTQQPPALPLTPQHGAPTRPIMYARANDLGRIDPRAWTRMTFTGFSLHRLRTELALLLNEEEEGITLCAWPDYGGRLTPLAVDLPMNGNYMAIVVLTTGSQVALELRYPNVDA